MDFCAGVVYSLLCSPLLFFALPLSFYPSLLLFCALSLLRSSYSYLLLSFCFSFPFSFSVFFSFFFPEGCVAGLTSVSHYSSILSVAGGNPKP